MSGLLATVPTTPFGAVQSPGGITLRAIDERDIDLLMGSVYCAWEQATQEEAQLALHWARQVIEQSRLGFSTVDETTYVLGGQYLQALISGRRRATVA